MRPELWLLLVLGLLGIVFFFLKFNESFPSASIDLRYNRNQVLVLAKEWAAKIGFGEKPAPVPGGSAVTTTTPASSAATEQRSSAGQPAATAANPVSSPSTGKTEPLPHVGTIDESAQGYINSTVFTYDDEVKTFLEYELGQSKANELMRKVVPTWMWQTRFCKPFQIEELTVSISPDGRLFGIRRSLPNEQPLPTISHDKALILARDFVEKTVGIPLTGMKLIKESEQKQAHRTDYYFNWEDQSRDFKDAHLRYDVYVCGDRVTAFSQQLHVPEKFERKFNEIRSYNHLLKSISSIVYNILSSAISFLFIWAFVSGRIRWKFAVGAGAIATVMSILSWIDGWPSLIAGYPTTLAFDQYITQSLISAALGGLYAGISAIVFVGALEPIYRLAFPKKLALERIPTIIGLRTAAVFQGLVAGLAVFGIHTAYVVGYYLLGNRIGFWSPMEIRETTTLSGLWPVYNAIDVGVSASTMEELMYRVLALSMFQRLTKNFWIANFLQACAWAFMHSDYPQEPAYARGVELTIGGFFYGYILQRFGLIACLLAHYTYDAFLGVTPLISSPNINDKLVSLLAIAPGPIFLLISSVLIKKKGQFVEVDSISNEAVQLHPPAVLAHSTETAPFEYEPASKNSLIVIAIATLAAILVVALVPMKTVGSNDQITVTREQAVRIASEHLLHQGLTTKGRRVVSYIAEEDDDTQLQYVLEKEKYKRTSELAKFLSPRLFWMVRFFKPMDPEQFYVAVGPEGKVLAQWISEDEDAPGAKLTQDEARKTAEQFLESSHAENKPYTFDDAAKHEQKNRNDYSFTFRVDRLHVGEADFKVNTGMVGKYVSNYNRSWDLPDKWLYERNKAALKDSLLKYCRWTYYVISFIAVLVWFIFTLRRGRIEWRWPITIGAAAALVVLIKQLNMLPMMFGPTNYSTDVPLATFIPNYISLNINAILSGTAAMALLTAIGLAAFSQVFPGRTFSELLHCVMNGDKHGFEGKRRLWRDGLIIGYGIPLILAGVDYLFDALSFLTSPAVHTPTLAGAVSASELWSPSLGAIVDAVSGAVMTAMGLLVSVALAKKYFGQSFWKLFVFIVVTGAINYTTLRYWQDYLWSTAAFITMGTLAYFFITRAARKNVVAYVLAGYSATLETTAYSFGKNAWALNYAHITVILLALAAPIVYVVWLFCAPRHLVDPQSNLSAGVVSGPPAALSDNMERPKGSDESETQKSDDESETQKSGDESEMQKSNDESEMQKSGDESEMHKSGGESEIQKSGDESEMRKSE